MGSCRCSSGCKKWTTFGISIGVVILGIFLAAFWRMIISSILNYELGISTTKTIGYDMWKETPIPMYLSFYFFNWTNADEVKRNSSIKPHFDECGPYTYHEHHIRDNITINDNATTSYYTRRIWKFVPEKSVGNLTDLITTVNPVVASVGNIVKDKNYIVQIGVDFFLTEKNVSLTVTKTVDEFTFTGYEDPMLDLLHKLNISGIDIPFTRFGWFVDRNNSREYDGFFNMNNGGDTIDNLGIVRYWNYKDRLPYYEGDCGKVEGNQGEIWYPPHEQESIKIFTSDLCSTLILERAESDELHGIQGYRYVGTQKTFDNGTKYPEMKCFLGKGFVGEQYAGIRNVSLCKYGSPAFVSFPHFYEADPAYLETVDGLKPDRKRHEMFITLEPTTGLPLTVRAQIQLNFKLFNVKHIKLLSNVVERQMPVFWFSQTAELSEDLASTAKLVITLPKAGQYTGFGLLVVGALIALIGFIVTYKRGWNDSEEEQLLDQNAL